MRLVYEQGRVACRISLRRAVRRPRLPATAAAATPREGPAAGMQEEAHFAAYPLARRPDLRGNCTSVATLPESASVLLFHNGAVLCHGGPAERESPDVASDVLAATAAPPVAARFTAAALAALDDGPVVFLGADAAAGDAHVYAAEVAAAAAALAIEPCSLPAGGGEAAALQWLNVRKDGGLLNASDAALAATAVGLFSFQARTRFAADTGAALTPTRGGWAMASEAGARCAPATWLVPCRGTGMRCSSRPCCHNNRSHRQNPRRLHQNL